MTPTQAGLESHLTGLYQAVETFRQLCKRIHLGEEIDSAKRDIADLLSSVDFETGCKIDARK